MVFSFFYSNSYFLKRRKRELGLYSLLGLRKGQVCAILVIENLLVYSLALVAGIVAGIFFLKTIFDVTVLDCEFTGGYHDHLFGKSYYRYDFSFSCDHGLHFALCVWNGFAL
ncbi:ABC transporter permease [Listeria aquatica]|uniref:ABC transporter permease n=1 Tax=Listeria aquatica TaxID=1494960 RepID=UPI003B97D2F8